MFAENWDKLEHHREQARRFPLRILIWGPSDDGSREYRARCELREKLARAGHDARFSEDLHLQRTALSNPLDDEFLQADAANLIIMLYGSRGTQTETDTLLSTDRIAAKTIILITEETYTLVTKKAVARSIWERITLLSDIRTYPKRSSPRCCFPELLRTIEKARTATYIQRLLREATNG